MNSLVKKIVIPMVFSMGFFFVSASLAEVPVIDVSEGQAITNTSLPLQQQVDRLQRQLTNREQMNLPGKITELQQSLQQLRGQLEVQAHDLKLMQQTQQALYKDLDGRLSKVNTNTPRPAIKTASINTTIQPSKIVRDTPPPVAIKNQADQHGQLNKQKELYNTAYQFLQTKQYSKAISSFQTFVHDYPKVDLAANAHYWLGELYLVAGQANEAESQFNQVLSQFPKSPKAGDALLKIGFLYADAGEFTQANKTLKQVISQYPHSGVSQLAQNKIKQLDRAGE